MPAMIPVDLLQIEIEYNPLLANPFHMKLWLLNPATKDLIILYGAIVDTVQHDMPGLCEENGYVINGL